jgi:hypothetical protein
VNKSAGSIVLYPRGGLGNQLFQYGAALQLSISLGCRIEVNDSLLNPKVAMNDGVASRYLELDEFENQISTSTNSGGIGSRLRSKLLTAQRIIGDRAPKVLLKFGIFANERTNQIEVFRSIRKSVVINSYCGSPAYFPDCQDELAQQISTIRNPSQWFQQTSNEVSDISPIGVHVRLGDYKNLGSIYGRPDPVYYANAVSLITKKIGERPVWLFSDEPELAQEIVGKHIKISKVIDPNASNRAIEHLNLLGKCQGIVCANSSFSWWSGFLSSKLIEDSVVVFPNPMFDSPELKEPENWIPAEWVRLERQVGVQD